MQLQGFADVGEFAARVEPYLLTHEATHCLMLGLLSTLPRDPSDPMAADEIPYMALIEERDEIVLVAMRTPPFPLILSLIAPDVAADEAASGEALALVADDVAARYQGGAPGVNAPVPVAQLFAERWQARTGRPSRVISTSASMSWKRSSRRRMSLDHTGV